MARINNLSNFLTDVADSIRRKKKTESTITPADFDMEIDSIPTGSTPNLQTKEVEVNQNGSRDIVADSGYDGLEKVSLTVDVPIPLPPTETINITENGTYNVQDYGTAEVEVPIPTPNMQSKDVSITQNGTTTVLPDSNYDGLSDVDITVNVQPNLQSKDVTISANGTTRIQADNGYDGLNDVDVTVEVPQPSGTINITTNGNQDVSNYASASVQVPNSPDWTQLGYEDTPDTIIDGFNYAKEIYDNWNPNITTLSSKYDGNVDLVVFPQVDTSKATNMSRMFRDARHLIYIPLLDTKNVTNMENAFASTAVSDFPLFDTSNVTNFNNTFTNNKVLKSLKAYNTSNATNLGSLCNQCSNLVDFPILNFNKATTLSTMVGSCTKLSNESLNNIMASLLTATVYTGTKTLRYIGLSSSQATTCTTLSNWQALSEAGWRYWLLERSDIYVRNDDEKITNELKISWLLWWRY